MSGSIFSIVSFTNLFEEEVLKMTMVHFCLHGKNVVKNYVISDKKLFLRGQNAKVKILCKGPKILKS